MAERFTRLFSLAENLYAEGSPVVISAGALQKDNQTGKVFAQLKFKNVTNKAIKAVKLKLFPLDTIGNAIEGAVEHEYLDLSAVRDEEFGQKTAVVFPNASTRGFSVEVTAVYFLDNSAWNGQNTEWSSLPKLESLEKNLADPELAKQYKLKYGADCKFAVLEHKDLWFCSCGALNNVSEDKCHICSKYLSYHKALSLDELKCERDLRLEKEQRLAKEAQLAAEREAEAKRAAEAEKAKKTKKLMKVLIPLLAIMIAIASIFVIIARKNSGVAEENFIEAIGNSMIEASEYAEKISSPSSDSEELVALYKTFAPYCGTFTWQNMDGTAVKEFSFVSDFYIEDGDVYWIYDDSDFTELSSLKAFYSNPKNESKPEYTFLQEPLLVDDMKAYERIEDDMMDLSVEFIDGKVVITSGYFENYLQGSKYVLTDKHYDIFTLSAIKAKENLTSYKEQSQDAANASMEKAYKEAIELMNSGNRHEAYYAFSMLGDYKDSEQYMEECKSATVLLSVYSELNGELGYEKSYEYKNGMMAKETMVCAADSNIGFHGYGMKNGDVCTAEYEYDEEQNLTEIRIWNNNDGKQIHTYSYEYDHRGNRIKETSDSVYPQGIHATFNYEYDERGNQTKMEWYEGGHSGIYSTSYYEYDENDELIRSGFKYHESGIKSDLTYVNEYDDECRLVKQCTTSSTGSYSETTYKYDEKGNVVEKKESYSNGTLVYQYHYGYDESGNLVKEIYHYGENTRVTTYTYGDVSIIG